MLLRLLATLALACLLLAPPPARADKPDLERLYANLVDDPTLPIDPHVRPRIHLGRSVSARDYLRTLAQMEEDRRAFAAATAEVDALLTPTTRTPAVPVDAIDQSGTPAHFTRAGNYLGLCAVAVPNGFTASGLPTSLQVLCPPGQEALALRIAFAYEQATAWRQRRPPLDHPSPPEERPR